jgi:hypothetical protein
VGADVYVFSGQNIDSCTEHLDTILKLTNTTLDAISIDNFI